MYRGPEGEKDHFINQALFGGHYTNHQPMFNTTRLMLTRFFNDHWDGRWYEDPAKLRAVAGTAGAPEHDCARGG